MVSLHLSGNTLASSFVDGTVKLWKFRNKANTKLLSECDYDIHSIAVDPETKTLFTGHNQGYIRAVDLETGNLLIEVIADDGSEAVKALIYSSKARILYSGSLDGTIQVWKLIKEAESGEFKL